MKKLAAWCIFLALLVSAASAEENWLEAFRKERGGEKTPAANVAVLHIAGELLEGGYGYDHLGTLDAIAGAEEDPMNQALVLMLDTPGGGLYEADELYHQLMVYKANTERPIYAYMGRECCSAGVLVAMAADGIAASRMSVTGNVGVYMETYSEAGLMDKLGIEREFIATGSNKVAGYPTLTEEQRAIHQAMVDESFGFFKQAIAESRGLTEEQMEAFLDGRMLTAFQAKELGLIDEVIYHDEMVAWLGGLFPEAEFVDVTPEEEGGLGLDGLGILDFLTELSGMNPADLQKSMKWGPKTHALRSI